MSIIEVRNAAKVVLPDDEALKGVILNMFSYVSRTGEVFYNYVYKDGVVYLPPSMHKLEIVAGLLGSTIVDCRSSGEKLSTPFVLNPEFKFRDYQVEPANHLLNHVRERFSGTLSAGCGTGKTVVMSYVAGQLGNKTLLLTDQVNIAANWADAYNLIYNKQIDILNAKSNKFGDVCLTTFQLLHRNPALLASMRSRFGCVLIDEAHVVKAATFKEVMMRLDTKYRIGCSATFFSKNLSTGILEDLIAPVCVTMVDNNALIPTVEWVDTGVYWSSETPNDFGSKILPELAASQHRLAVIVQTLRRCLAQNRRTIVVCIKVDQAKRLSDLLQRVGARTVVYVGTTSAKRDREVKHLFETGQLDFVFVSKKMDKGVDFPSADCVVMTKPNNNLKDTQQITGRVVRKVDGKPKPWVIDFRDKGYLAEIFANNRDKFYRKLKYEVSS